MQDHADREWKFARSKLWMGYFDEGSTLPPPFNLIISPKFLFRTFKSLFQWVTSCCRKKKRNRKPRKSIDSGSAKVSQVLWSCQASHILFRFHGQKMTGLQVFYLSSLVAVGSKCLGCLALYGVGEICLRKIRCIVGKGCLLIRKATHL